MSPPEDKNATSPSRSGARKAAPSVTAVAKDPTRRVRRLPPQAPQPVPLPKVVLRLVYEAVAARVRHRALLAVLESGDEVTHDRYIESYKTVYDRDHEALLSVIMFERDDFLEAFGDWHRRDLEAYGIPDRIDAIRRRSSRKRKTSENRKG